MATYDYKCENCEHTFETEHGMTEPELTDCPECKEPKLKRLITSAPAIAFGKRTSPGPKFVPGFNKK